MKRSLLIVLLVAIIGCVSLITIAGCNMYITHNAKNRTFDNDNDIPYNKVGLVLGTSPTTKNGRINYYFINRVQAAAELYFAGKISYILVSGDNHVHGYNEPKELKKAIVAAGVPENVIYLDYAGLRTLDSIVRAKKVFGQDSLTIISQKWHNERAIYLADHAGINAVAYNAADIFAKRTYIKNHLRETAAREKAIFDVITHKNPKFLGEKITIGK